MPYLLFSACLWGLMHVWDRSGQIGSTMKICIQFTSAPYFDGTYVQIPYLFFISCSRSSVYTCWSSFASVPYARTHVNVQIYFGIDRGVVGRVCSMSHRIIIIMICWTQCQPFTNVFFFRSIPGLCPLDIYVCRKYISLLVVYHHLRLAIDYEWVSSPQPPRRTFSFGVLFSPLHILSF